MVFALAGDSTTTTGMGIFQLGAGPLAAQDVTCALGMSMHLRKRMRVGPPLALSYPAEKPASTTLNLARQFKVQQGRSGLGGRGRHPADVFGVGVDVRERVGLGFVCLAEEQLENLKAFVSH